MDLQYFTLAFTTSTVILFVLFLSRLSKLAPRGSATLKRIPGPSKFPLIGSMHHFSGSDPPHHALRELARKHGPIMHLKLGEISTIVISDVRLAKEVMKTHDLVFSNRPNTLAVKTVYYNGQDVAFSPYGEYWKQMRKICTQELLSAKKVRSFASIRVDEARNLIESIRLSPVSTVNLSKMLSSYSNAVICRATFGKTSEVQEAMAPLFAEIMEFMGSFDVADLFPSLKFLHGLSEMRPKLERAHQKLDTILDSVINERREILANTKKDNADPKLDDKYLLDILLRLEEDGGLDFPITSNNIKAIIGDIFIGGTDTTSSAIDWAMAELMRNPRVMAKAQAEVREAVKAKKSTIYDSDHIVEALSYLKLVVSETLRLHTPSPLLPRISRDKCEIGGYVLPANTSILINAWALGRDPEFWKDDPESFIPERFENTSHDFTGSNMEYLPFGAGRRMCPGINFGMANIMFPLAQLLYHFNWNLPNGMKPEELDMGEGLGLGNTRKANLYVVATTSDHSPPLPPQTN